MNGLSALQSVGSHFYLHTNQLTNIDGLTALTSVGGNFNIGSNQITNLKSLTNLTNVGGYVALYNNANLTDISGIENVTGSPTKLFYIDVDQYTIRADGNSSMCSTKWDLRDSSGDIPDDMNHVCTGQDPYVVSDADKFKAVLESKCNIAASTFNSYFNVDTGHYSQSINCYTNLTDEDMLNFKALKSVGGSLSIYSNSALTNLDGLSNLKSVGSTLYLENNQLTNVDGLAKLESVGGELYLRNNKLTNVNGLSSLKTVGSNFYLENNQLTNVNGLSNLTSVGNLFYLHNNQLTNVNGLSALQSVGSHFYLHTNQLTNIDGLTSLTSVGGNFHVGSNQITNLDSLTNLTNVGGYVALYNNANLTDISGIENVTGSPTKFFYIDADQYTTRADVNSSLCSTTWDLRDSSGDIPDDMNYVCTGQDPYVVSDADKFKAVLESKCNIAASTFNSYFNVDTGHYSQSISCYTNLTGEDMLNFKALKSVGGYLYIYSNSALTNLDGLSNLKSVGSTLYLENNQLTNVDGLAKLESVGGELYLRNNKLTNVNGLSSLKTVGSNFYLENNQLTNVNGLSNLTSVGGLFYLQSNQLTNIDGLNALTSVGNNFNVENNQLTNLDGLSHLTHVGGYVALRNNANLTDISGAENIEGSPTKYFYITPDQYSTRADGNSSMCSTKWDLRDSSGDIPDDMNYVCTGQDPYVVSDADKLKGVLESKCNIAASTFNSYFNVDTGHYSQSISCYYTLTDEDMLNFKALKSVGGYLQIYSNSALTNLDGLSNLKSVGSTLYLENNQLTNVDGLVKLESVGGELYLRNNKLTNVNGLSSLKTVGSNFYLENNQLTNVNGLSNLTSVGGLFYLQSNQLTNIDGLNALTSVGNNFNVENNQLTNLDSLTNLTHVGGYVALRNNANLTDISGASNIVGSDGKVLYITPNQYTTKAYSNLKFCSAIWDLKDINGDIDDNMTLVCGDGAALTEEQQLRAVMELKCSVSYAQFAAHFDEATGVYDTSLDCAYQELTDEDLMKFSILNEIQGSFSINDNNLTNLDGLSNLSSIGGYFYLYNNNINDMSGLSSLASVGGILNLSSNALFNVDGLNALTSVQGLVKLYHNNSLDDVSGLTNITGFDGKQIYIDSTNYAVKADSTGSLCASRWDLYDTAGNIADDMRKLCDGYSYAPSDADRLRDVLGKRCGIASLEFYSNFEESTGIYTGDLSCTGVQDSEMSNFKGLLEAHGSFSIEDSNITTTDELIRLKKVTGTVSIQNNANLTNIHGLSNILGNNGQKLIIDDATQYDIKADETLEFCLTGWDIYTGTVNSTNDMTTVCAP